MGNDWCRYGVTVGLLVVLSCRPTMVPPPPPVEPSPPAVPEAPPSRPAPEKVQEELKRREQVAAALTDRGRSRLEAGQPDAAIRLFERALSQSPRFGPGYYYLAQAWLMKNKANQAQAFHDQAVLYLQDQPEWRHRLDRQQKEIKDRIAEYAIP